MDSEANL